MKEQLISFETAKLAKEKDFNEGWNNLHYYEALEDRYDYNPYKKEDFLMYKKGDIKLSKEPLFETKCLDHGVASPQSLLQKWLREIHNIRVFVLPGFRWIVERGTARYKKVFDYKNGHYLTYKTYEEALEAGLQEVLKLI